MMIFGISIMGYHHLKRRLLDDSWREISHEYPRNRWPFQDPQELLAGDFPACHVWIARGHVSLKTSKNIHHFLLIPITRNYIYNISFTSSIFLSWFHMNHHEFIKKWRGFLRCRFFSRYRSPFCPSGASIPLRRVWLRPWKP